MNVLHIIDMGTAFQNGGFINYIDSETTYKMVLKHWVDVYERAPDYIYTGSGTSFNSVLFHEQAASMGTIVRKALTEGHDRIELVERSREYLCTVYDKLRTDLPNIKKEEKLSMAFRAINDLPSAESGISPTTSVFGVYPKIPGEAERGLVMKRSKIIRDCTEIVSNMKSRRVLRGSVRGRSCPSLAAMEK